MTRYEPRLPKKEMPLLWIKLWKLLDWEVAMQCQLSQMQEASKASIHYLKYGQNSKSDQRNKAKKTTKLESTGTPGNFQLTLQGSGKDRKTPICFCCGTGKQQKGPTMSSFRFHMPRMWKERTSGKHMSI